LSEADPELIAENLACRRGERWIFTGLSFRVAAGGALVLTGSNGSGKTSLLRILATLMPAARGRLLWGTAPIEMDLTAYRAQLIYVGHQDRVKPSLTPRETLAFWAALHGLEVHRPPLLDAALGAFALEEMADWPCGWLSAGQRRRLALAALVAAPAPIWLLDEPTSGLDYESQIRLERTIATHRAAGGRVIVASHTPIDIAAAVVLTLDAFSLSPEYAAAG
jgi:heme exporter protein A